MGECKHIMLVYTNNISRSFMVEVVLNQLIREKKDCNMSVKSRGLVVLFSEPVSAKVADMVRGHGYAISNFQSEQLTQRDIEESDLILTITGDEKQKLYKEFSVEEYKRVYTLTEFAGKDMDIIDPYGQNQEVYEQCFDTLRQLAESVFYKMQD